MIKLSYCDFSNIYWRGKIVNAKQFCNQEESGQKAMTTQNEGKQKENKKKNKMRGRKVITMKSLHIRINQRMRVWVWRGESQNDEEAS